MYERPLKDLKSLEQQLIEQETKNFVFKIKEKETIEISVVNKYTIFNGYGQTIREFLYSDLLEESIIQALLNSEHSIERVLIFDEYLNPLFNKSQKRSRYFNFSSPEGKFIETTLKSSVDFALGGKFKQHVFTYLMVNKLCVVSVLETRNDILFFIFITSTMKLKDTTTETTSHGCLYVQNAKDFLPTALKKIEGFYDRLVQWYSVAQSQKDQCEKDWIKTNLSFSQKNGRKFFKNKHTSTVITPADDDPTKYITPRPPPVSNITTEVNNASFTSSTSDSEEYEEEEEPEQQLAMEKPQPSPPKLPPQEMRFVRSYKTVE